MLIHVSKAFQQTPLTSCAALTFSRRRGGEKGTAERNGRRTAPFPAPPGRPPGTAHPFVIMAIWLRGGNRMAMITPVLREVCHRDHDLGGLQHHQVMITHR